MPVILKRNQLVSAAAVLLIGGGIAAYAWQGQRGAPQSAAPVAAHVDTAPQLTIKPHRALYQMQLADSESNSTINNVGGKMLFTWGDACDGWTIEQRLDLRFMYNGGNKQRIKTSLATWEAKDGSAFRFSVRRAIDGKDKENYQGHAQLAADGSGNAEYSQPNDREVKLSPKTIFPTVHTLRILQAALAGQHHISGSVFDGADEAGRNEISAFIGKPKQVEAPAAAKNRNLRQGRAWPVQMAFFTPENKTGIPDYEMEMTLLENGVASDLLIDYGDFTVKAVLKEIEPLAKPAC